MNFQTQAEQYLSEIASVARPNTLQVYRSLLSARILPAIGQLELSEVDNMTVKSLVGRLAEANLSPATIGLTVTLVKQVLKSAVDERGNPLFIVVWNTGFIKAPEVVAETQKAPIMGLEALSQALGRTNGEVKALVALLAGTGLRIGEALAVGAEGGNVWDPTTATVTITATVVNGTVQQAPKTRAGRRVVDIHPELNTLLRSQFANRESRMFTRSDDFYRDRIAALGIPGFHSLRRLRVTHLQLANVPESLIKFWVGHAAEDTTERYTKVGSEIAVRKEWAEKAGLGFTL